MYIKEMFDESGRLSFVFDGRIICLNHDENAFLRRNMEARLSRSVLPRVIPAGVLFPSFPKNRHA